MIKWTLSEINNQLQKEGLSKEKHHFLLRLQKEFEESDILEYVYDFSDEEARA